MPTPAPRHRAAHRPRGFLAPLVLATGSLLLVAPPATAAPAVRHVTVVCDQVGEVPLDVTAASVAVPGGGPVRVARPSSEGALRCGTVPAVPGQAARPVFVSVDVPAVLAAANRALSTTASRAMSPAGGGRMSGAALASDPAGYGRVVAFPYRGTLAAYLSKRSGSTSVAFRGANSSTIYVHTKGSATNVTASIVKVQVLSTLLLKVQQERRRITPWEARQAAAMIHFSDNDATTALWNHVGRGPAVARLLAREGLRSTVPGSGGYWGLTVTTAPDQVVLVDHLARRNPVLNDSCRAYALALMRGVTASQAWGVSAGPGRGMAIKNGWLPRSDGWHVNSIGFSAKAPRPYAIGVLTSADTTMNTQIATIEGVSRIVWAHRLA